MLEVRHLHLIKEIAEKGSLTQAAKKLFLTQPSLSHQLKDIETKLGALLFHRVNRKMVMTPAGKQVLNLADQALPLFERVEKEIKNSTTGEHSEIRLCTECYTGYHWLPLILKKFQLTYPTIQIDIVTEAMNDPVHHLLAGKIDIALVIGKPEKMKHLLFEKLFDDEQVLVVHQDHPLAGKEFVRPNDFASENFIMYREAFEENFFARRFLIPAGIKPRKVTRMQLTEARVELAKAGMGVTILSKWLVSPFITGFNQIKLVRINKKGVFRPWYIAYVDQSRRLAYLTDFIEFIKKEKLGTEGIR